MTVVPAPTEEKLLTGEELLALGDIGPCELIDGRVVRMSPTGTEHAVIEFTLGAALQEFVSARQLGRVVGGEVGIYTRRNPDRVRGADVAFISKTRMPQKPMAGFLTIAPELAVEIVSPSDTWPDIRQKVKEYFAIGVERVWVIDPENREASVYRTAKDVTTLTEDEALRGEGVLDSFELPLRTLFED
jgi:Uma2 family endonuclease